MGIDLPRDIGTSRLRWQRLARIINYLPEDSATVRARRAGRPPVHVQLLREIEFWNHLLFWSKTEDSKDGTNRPARIPLMASEAPKVRRDTMGYDQKLQARQQRRDAELKALQIN